VPWQIYDASDGLSIGFSVSREEPGFVLLHTRLIISGVLVTAAAAAGGFVAVLWWGLEPWAAVALFLTVVFLADIPLAWVANQVRPVSGPEAMIGETAVVEAGFDESHRPAAGQVRWRNELWDARLRGTGDVRLGEEVTIVAVRGLRLDIERRGQRTG
jgi:membrane protein implicated in regulation of membrane protease activity